MSAQPLNTTIKVHRNIRGRRDDHRTDTIEILTKRLRSLIAVVPGYEVLSGVLARDTTVSDMSPYMGQAKYSGRGFPIVVGLLDTVDFSDAQEGLADVEVAFKIGRDQFITNTSAGLDGDLFGDAAAL
jgi:hypothetical protein